jgi:hypothetical protein
MDEYLRYGLCRNIEKWAPKDPERRNVFFRCMSFNRDMSIDVLSKYPRESWDAHVLANNPNFSWDWVERFPNFRWNWRDLSFNSPTIDIVLRNLDKDWDWYILTTEPGVTFIDMVNYPNLPWFINQVLFEEIYTDADLTFLRMYKDHYDDVAWIDHSRRAPWEVIKKAPDLPWRYHAVSYDIKDESDVEFLTTIDYEFGWGKLSTTVDADLIIKTKHTAPWHWNLVSKNKTLTYDHVIANPDIEWNYSIVPAETFSESLARMWMAAYKIQCAWRKARYCPEFKTCKRCLIREFENGLEDMILIRV